MWPAFSWLCFLCSVVGVAGMRPAPVCGIVAQVMSVEEVWDRVCYASWMCHSVSDDGDNHQPKGSKSSVMAG